MTPGGARTVLLAGGQPMWLEAVQAVVEGEGLSVAATASSPDEVLAHMSDNDLDLLIVDVDEGELDSSLIRRVRETSSETRIVGLTINSDTGHIATILGAGATAIVLKTAQPGDLALTIAQAFSTSVFFAPAIRPERYEDTIRTAEATERLTRREIEILRLVAEGHSNSQLAQMLWVTEQTVKFHLSNVYRKLRVTNRTEASRWAQLHGLLTADTPATAAAA